MTGKRQKSRRENDSERESDGPGRAFKEGRKRIERRKGEDREETRKAEGGGEVVKLITEQIGLKTDWANRKMSVCMLQSVVQPIASCTQ